MVDADVTATLLPAARVDIYALDDGTRALGEKLASDWRFARVNVNVQNAGIDAAIASYTQAASPDLVLIETNDIGADFTGKLGTLAGVCAEGTEAVVIGPVNDVPLYRSLVGMGVRDYLVRPLSEGDIVQVIAQALVAKHGLSNARLIAVVGGKGGVGSTSVAQLLAWDIAERLDQKTLLMDVAGSNGTLGVSYGVEPVSGFAESVRVGVSGTEDDVRRILQKVTENLSILVTGGDPVLSARPEPDAVEAMVNRMLQKHPVVVVDLSGASRAVQKRMVTLAARVVVVTTPLLSSLRNTRTYMLESKALRSTLNEVDLVVNMQGMAAGEEVSLKDIEATLGKAPSARIPYAPKIFAASEAAGKPVGQDGKAKDIMNALSAVSGHAAGITAIQASRKDAAKKGAFDFLKKSGKNKK
jgi:pilus assembly protein CpaE